MGGTGEQRRLFDVVGRRLRQGVELFEYGPSDTAIAAALREHLHEQRRRAHVGFRLPLHVFNLTTPTRRHSSWRMRSQATAFSLALDLAVWRAQKSPDRDGLLWRFPLYGLELAWLARLAPDRRIDADTALTVTAPVMEAVVLRGLAPLAAGIGACVLPVVVDHRRRKQPIAVRSMAYPLVGFAGGTALRILARQRAQLAEVALAKQKEAAASTGEFGAASTVTRNGTDASLKDLLTDSVLERLHLLGRDDLVLEAESLRRLRDKLEQGIAGGDGSPPRYYELSTVLSGWARQTAEGKTFVADGSTGRWQAPKHEVISSQRLGSSASRNRAYSLTFATDDSGIAKAAIRVLTAAQRLELLTTCPSVRLLDPAAPLLVEDLTPLQPTGAALLISITDGERTFKISLPEDRSEPMAQQPYDPSTLAFILQVLWSWAGSRTQDPVGTTVVSALAATVYGTSRVRYLSPTHELVAAVTIQLIGSSIPRGSISSGAPAVVASIAMARLPALLLAAYWERYDEVFRLVAVATVSLIAVTTALINYRRWKSADLLLECIWVIQAVWAARGLWKGLVQFDAALEAAISDASETARSEADESATRDWLAKANKLHDNLRTAVLDDPSWPSAQILLQDLEGARHHLDSLGTLVRNRDDAGR